MNDIAEISEQVISRDSIVLGFAYSLTPEGFPGDYNEKLAAQLNGVISHSATQAPDDRPWIGMQWEIFDAIESKWDNSIADLREIVPLSHIGGPPLFEKEHVANVDTIVRHLKLCYDDLQAEQSGKPLSNPSTQAGRALARKVAELLHCVGYAPESSSAILNAAMFDQIKVAQYFNQILEDNTFHQNFYGDDDQPFLEVHDLYRTDLGSVGVENRRLPGREAKTGQFQRRRVNRFIIEAVFPNETILKPGKYLSTRGVLDQVAGVIKREGERRFVDAYVYGHPEHSPRCRRQLIESSWEANWNLLPGHVYDVNKGKESEWEWDASTAQMWCRSKPNWDDYERMGKARID